MYVSKQGLKPKIREAVLIAKDLCYSKEVIEKIKKAKTEYEIQLVLTTARLAMCEI